MSKNHTSSYVEIKTVTWSKDSHGLFDYESKNINFTKHKSDSVTKIFKEGNEITIKDSKGLVTPVGGSENDEQPVFSVIPEKEKEGKFFLSVDDKPQPDEDKAKSAFIIVRSLKSEEGNQKGYDLELGDIIRLGRVEYRFIEYQDENMQIFSLLQDKIPIKSCPFTMVIKDCNIDPEAKRQCRICLMDEEDTDEALVNPCNCKGTSEHVHIKCLQDWISSKVKRKMNTNTACSYWKKLNCEVCKVSLPDLVDIKGEKKELIPISRPETPYILLERVFYDKSKVSGENSKMMILLALADKFHQIKLGRGHECDLRENDISVSRLHAFIRYQNGRFAIFDNNSKFGTLILLRRNYEIGKKKIALQIGRTVVTFSLKQSLSVNSAPIIKPQPLLMEKLMKWYAPKNEQSSQTKVAVTCVPEKSEGEMNSSFLD